MPSAPSDAALLHAWRAGDRDAGRELVDRHYPAIARFFTNKVGDEAGDLVHRTFLACVESKAPFRGDASVRTYLFAIARSELYAHYRRRHTEAPRFDEVSVVELADADASPSRAVAESEEQRLLLEALRRIPLAAQILLELFYWEELTTREIAEILELPHGTVRSRVRAARHQLEAELGALARAPTLLASTLDNLDRWLASMRAHLGDPS